MLFAAGVIGVPHFVVEQQKKEPDSGDKAVHFHVIPCPGRYFGKFEQRPAVCAGAVIDAVGGICCRLDSFSRAGEQSLGVGIPM